jgi:hypothetical protein
MNKEIIKAMNRKEKKHPIKDWWKKNGYKVLRVILFPVWVFALGMDKIQKKLNARQKWSEKRAKEIFDYYVPRKAEWSEEDKTFYFFDNGMGWGNLAKKYLKLKDRRWWDCHRGFWGSKLRTYLIEEYELEGFTKEIGNCSDGWTEISFTKIDE